MTTKASKTPRKSLSGLAIFAVVILLIIVQAQRMSVEHTYCEDDVPVPGQQGNKTGSLNTEGAPDVLMLGAVCCPACKAVIRFLDKNNLNYCEYDIETNALGASLYKEVNGRGAHPVHRRAPCPWFFRSYGDQSLAGHGTVIERHEITPMQTTPFMSTGWLFPAKQLCAIRGTAIQQAVRHITQKGLQIRR